LLLEVFADLFESTWGWEGFGIDPAFELSTRLSFDDVRRIDADVETEE